MIIDTHVHMWDLKQLSLPWLEVSPTFKVFNRSLDPDDYGEDVAEIPLEKAIFIETDVAPQQLDKEVELVTEICRRADNPFCGMVIGVDFFARSFRDYIDRHARNPFVKGVRRPVVMPDHRVEHFYPEDTIIDHLHYVGQKGLHVEICFRYQDLHFAIELAKHCPETQFVLNHCGNPLADPVKELPTVWQEAIARLGALENVACKISGIIDIGNADVWQLTDTSKVVDICVEAFGEDRICFGSNWPVCWMRTTIKDWYEFLIAHLAQSYNDSLRRKFFYGNAVKIYRL